MQKNTKECKRTQERSILLKRTYAQPWVQGAKNLHPLSLYATLLPIAAPPYAVCTLILIFEQHNPLGWSDVALIEFLKTGRLQPIRYILGAHFEKLSSLAAQARSVYARQCFHIQKVTKTLKMNIFCCKCLPFTSKHNHKKGNLNTKQILNFCLGPQNGQNCVDLDNEKQRIEFLIFTVAFIFSFKKTQRRHSPRSI